MRLVMVAILCSACGRIGFEDRLANDDGGGTDDGSGVECWAAWKSGAPTFASVRPITELSLPDKQGNPWLHADGRTLYFDTGTGDTELFRATRAGRGQPFGPPQQLTEVTSAFEESGIVITADDRIAVMASSRPGSQGFDLWMTQRPDAASQFGTPVKDAFLLINNGANQFDAFLTANGLTLTYAQSATGGQNLMMATRPTPSAAFGSPIPLPGANNFSVEADPDLSPDELVLVFSANSPLQLHAATRASTAVPFGQPFRIDALLGGGHDADPAFSADGCEVFFVSDRLAGDRDLWLATVNP